jgi:transcriptional regulator with XRE-family HTH domain
VPRKRTPGPAPPPRRRGAFAPARLEGLPDALRFLRERRGWSQDQLAHALGTRRAVVSTWECGKKTPSLEALAAVAGALELDLGDLDDALEVVTGRPPRPLREPLVPHQIDSGTVARLLLGTRTVLPLDEDHAALVEILDLVRGILSRRRAAANPTPGKRRVRKTRD